MTIRTLINQYSYKKIFNLIYKNYYKDAEYSDAQHADVGFYNAWTELSKMEKPKEKDMLKSIYVTQVSDDLEPDADPYIDVTIREKSTDELWGIDFIPWDQIIDLDIENASSLGEDELLAAILWEITFWGFSSSKIEQNINKIREEHSDPLKTSYSEWKEISKELKDIFKK